MSSTEIEGDSVIADNILSSKGSIASIELMKQELLEVTLRQNYVRKRIQSIRRGLATLVQIFGPHVLDQAQHDQAKRDHLYLHNVSYRCPRTLDICRQVLKQSERCLTLDQILDLMYVTSPASLASFQNPAASVSNALRTLHRHAEIKAIDDGSEVKWRWIR